jgi:AraC-like DNA-binding protein
MLMTTGLLMAKSTRGEQLLGQADSLYAAQQYKEALATAREALPLTKGTEGEADCLNLLAIINIRLSDYQEAARYAKDCYALDEKTGDPDFIEKAINTINELILSGQIDANHVAECLGMSLFQFRQRLTALTDETPQAFIQNIRMKRARHLLDNHPELNISEIATLCAYNDTPNFTRAFKKTFGVTPTQYLDRKG